ncbi:hypothetical protein P3T26_006940 [Streptomyces sp. MAA16]|nr:hypothetical protein [Streptomyces sp. MAA16]
MSGGACDRLEPVGDAPVDHWSVMFQGISRPNFHT